MSELKESQQILNSKVERAVPQGCLGGNHNEFICRQCNLHMIIAGIGTGTYANTGYPVCPVCSSMSKEATPKLTTDEALKKKTEIRKRIYGNNG
jgi:hypothetical protein